MFKKRPTPSSSNFFDDIPIPVAFEKKAAPYSNRNKIQPNTAIIYCEANFGGTHGKTTTGFIRDPEKFEILSIIDSEKAGRDAGEVLNAQTNGIPIFRDLNEALADADHVPGHLIFGITRASGIHSPDEKRLILEAIEHGMQIVNGFQEAANQDPTLTTAGSITDPVG